MNLILFDDNAWDTLRPLTLTRPVSELRAGILTLRQQWELDLHLPASHLTRPYLREKYPLTVAPDNLLVNASLSPDSSLVDAVLALRPGQSLWQADLLLAFRADAPSVHALDAALHPVADAAPAGDALPLPPPDSRALAYTFPLDRIAYPHHTFAGLHPRFLADFRRLTSGRTSAPVPSCVRVRGSHPLFIEPDAVLRDAIINTDGGPVYVGHGAEVMEGCLLRGPVALCDHAVLNMGTRVYGPTVIGPYSKCGGELNNVILMAYSNKAHDGFLGNAILGQWCNLGAATNNSNLKNTYDEVRLWDYASRHFRSTGLRFCGLVMGDHSKTAIGTVLNTGTVVGVGVNIFGSGFPRAFVPSFSWGGAAGFTEHAFPRFLSTASIVMQRRGVELTDIDRRLLRHVFDDPSR